jgi:hypothetical protein
MGGSVLKRRWRRFVVASAQLDRKSDIAPCFIDIVTLDRDGARRANERCLAAAFSGGVTLMH